MPKNNSIQNNNNNELIAYVDGSFNGVKYGFGCVFITPESEIIRESGCASNPKYISTRNIAGEIAGAVYAIKWCVKHGYNSIKIYYDYKGIACWATGAWKANIELTQNYVNFIQKYNKKINISFKKVKAHKGNKYNEEADKLAKDALGISY